MYIFKNVRMNKRILAVDERTELDTQDDGLMHIQILTNIESWLH